MEDINVINKYIYDSNRRRMNYIDIDNVVDDECDNFIQAIENLIARNKELESALNNSVSKDEIKKLIDYIEEEGYWEFTTDRDSDKARELLQELLNKGE